MQPLLMILFAFSFFPHDYAPTFFPWNYPLLQWEVLDFEYHSKLNVIEK